MSCILYVDDEEAHEKLDIDELYLKKQQRDLKQLAIFNKILNRVHKRIKFTGRHKPDDKFIWFTIPEYIFGEPLYDRGDCIGYIVAKLEDNGFHVRYVHPNTLFVGWHNWIPSYVRTEFKKKRGIAIDEFGRVIENKTTESLDDDYNTQIFNEKNQLNAGSAKEQKQYTPIQQYKPTGNLVYNPEHFEKLERRVKFENGSSIKFS